MGRNRDRAQRADFFDERIGLRCGLVDEDPFVEKRHSRAMQRDVLRRPSTSGAAAESVPSGATPGGAAELDDRHAYRTDVDSDSEYRNAQSPLADPNFRMMRWSRSSSGDRFER